MASVTFQSASYPQASRVALLVSNMPKSLRTFISSSTFQILLKGISNIEDLNDVGHAKFRFFIHRQGLSCADSIFDLSSMHKNQDIDELFRRR